MSDDPKAKLAADLFLDAAKHRAVALVALRRIVDAAVSSVDCDRATALYIRGIAQKAIDTIEGKT